MVKRSIALRVEKGLAALEDNLNNERHEASRHFRNKKNRISERKKLMSLQ
jgi:hypothetical protein